ncbi:MAG: preprotein translocase subunit YajC [Elusimicrobiota bacterium]|jgi:preprotein translocase subunit YajC|nr:preprotein translocase subunit YajC [Elusimicrobiota bacterium]
MEPTTVAAGAAAAAPAGMNMNAIIVALIVFMLVSFFFSSKATKKRAAEQKKIIDGLQKGEKVVLTGGIVGVVAGFNDGIIEVKVSETTKLSVLPSGIITVYKAASADNKATGAK